jgi:hypothetical protein
MRWAIAFLLLVPAAAAADSLYVAGEKGVREVGLDGSTVRALTHTPARWPRLLPGGKALLYVATDKGELRRVALDGGADSKVAALPASATVCAPTGDAEPGRVFELHELGVQEDADFIIDRGGGAACLSLKDRNVNMLNIDVHVRVELGSGKMASAIFFPEGCPGAPVADCEAAAAPPPPAPAAAPWDVKDGWLVHDGKKVARLGQGEFGVETVAPGGRWAVIHGPNVEADYIHRSLYLLERSTGVLRAIDAKATIIPRKRWRKMTVETLDAVGESTIRWLGADVLLVDQALVFPGKGLRELDGDVAPP